LKTAKDELEELRRREAEFNEMKMLLESKALGTDCFEHAAAGGASEVKNEDYQSAAAGSEDK
jgi:hypothetical protein